MPTDIVMPQMGESIVEGTITKWLKKPGDKVQRDEPLFEISTDKVDAEIPAPASGVLQDIKVTEGTTVQVNTVVGTIATDGESAAAAAKPVAAPPPAPAPIPGDLVPATQMRKIIAQRMIESRRTSAHVHSMFEVDLTRIVNLRNKLKAGFEQRHGARLTFMPFFVRAAIIALQQFPIVNASVEGEGIRYHRHVNMGIAVALDWGLIVPVLKNADDLNFLGLQRGITDLGERARSKKLKPEEVEGSTFTITNPGQFGAVFGLPIINQPNSAIMGVGGIAKVPLVVTDADGNDSIAIRSVVHLTLGYDHRLIDGAVADQFMALVKRTLENWSEEVG